MGLWRQQCPVLIEVKIQLNNELNHQLLSLKSLANGRQSKFNLNMDASWSGHKTFWMSLLANIRWTKGTLGNRTGWDISRGLHSKNRWPGSQPGEQRCRCQVVRSRQRPHSQADSPNGRPSHIILKHPPIQIQAVTQIDLNPFLCLRSYTQKLKVEETMKSWRLSHSFCGKINLMDRAISRWMDGIEMDLRLGWGMEDLTVLMKIPM